MAEIKLTEQAPCIENLRQHILAISKQEGLSEENVIERLMDRLGYKMPKRILPKLKVNLNIELKTFLKQKETEIANNLKRRKKALCTDHNDARLIVRTALCNFYNLTTEKKIKKNDADKFLGYCGRTMRLHQTDIGDKISDPDSKSKEREIYQELCVELKQFAT